MKKTISILLILVLAFAFAACSAKTDNLPETTTETSVESTSADSTEEKSPVENIVIIYFSQTGTTKSVAEKIAGINGGDLFEITAAEPYSEDDINWHDDNSRAAKEQNDKSARPKIENDTVNLDAYSTIYLGYPIWFGQAPRIMDTFVESHDFDGKRVIPFCTSGSSDIGSSDNYLAGLAKSGDWLEGKRFGANAAESEIEEWIKSVK